jgi:DNA-binding CsgD family transcriptional regulator
MTDAAAAMHEAMRPYGHLIGTAGGEPVTGSMQRPLGQVAALLGRWDEAQRHHERALEVHTRMRAELWIAHSECDLAEVLRQQSEPDVERAEHLYARALHRCETLGMTALAARIRAARGKVRAAGTRPGGLTKREVEVAALVAAGASNREIADALVISERTAESHVQNILTKLGFGSRSQIASWATTERLTANR